MKWTCWIVAILLAILPFSVAWGQVGVRGGASFGYGDDPPRFRTDRGSGFEIDFGGLYVTAGIAYVF